MRVKFKLLVCVVALLSTLALLWVSSYATTATTDLGTMGGDCSYVTAINSKGQAVGYSELSNGE
ncbi:MAG TPA: hypothetical protein VF941_09520, partial [Clostridia bacterium]